MSKVISGIFLFSFFGFSISPTWAQNPRFKFGITESGVYKITSSEARQLGFSDLSEIAVFGYPGMLPQILDSAQLSLQEISTWTSNDAIFFFLEGPNKMELSETGEIDYLHHLYSDTLNYILGKSSSPKKIREKAGESTLPDANATWYTFKSLKEEKSNQLTSGRSWFSDPIRQGQSLAINFGVSSTSSSPWLLKAKVMSQSNSGSQMRIFSGNDQLAELSFNPISTATYGIKGREDMVQLEFSPTGNRLSQLRFSFQGNGSGYLDFAAIGIPFSGKNISDGVFFGKKPAYIELQTGKQYWELSDFYEPVIYTSGQAALGKKWIVFSELTIKSIRNPIQISKKTELKPETELLIISVPSFQQAANRLKTHKESLGIPTELVFVSDIFDWYGYGNKDISAIRNFIANTYHGSKRLKNVLILGKGTIDYKGKLGGRPNLIPIYTSESSLDPLTTYSSDDFFALVEWGQGKWKESKEGDELLAIGIGRIPAITFREASTWVDKIIRYETSGFEGFPSNTITFFSDDGDNGIHMRDAEVHAAFLEKNYPFYRNEKLFLDFFEQEKSGISQSSSSTKKALGESLNRGTLLLNYIGHGNETTLTAEEVFKIEDIENWSIQNPLPLWVTATCEFGRHDSPFLRSAAEELLFADRKGAIGLLTTGRPVFSSVNFSLNQAFIEEVFKNEAGFGQDLGTIFRNTKNKSLNGPFNRNFSLLGDPSLRLQKPELAIQVRQVINSKDRNPSDTIRSLDRLELHGEISDPLTAARIPNFNGKFKIELWDKPTKLKTLGDENAPFEFQEEMNLLFKGEGDVKNGEFSTRLIVPELLNKEPGRVRFRLYAWDDEKKTKAGGLLQKEISGTPTVTNSDQEGPKIKIELQGSGQTSYSIPTLQTEIKASFSDQSGIYISSEDPSKILRVSVNQNNPYFINRYYSALENNFTQGTAKFVLMGLKEGTNEVEISAWDNVGNLGQQKITIEVRGSNQIQILDHRVFPNPTSEESTFSFRHNRPGENLVGTLEVYSLSGNILFSETKRFVKAEENIQGWNWIFFQGKSKYPAKGTYIYKLSLRSESGFDSDTVSGKLVIQ